MLTGETRNRIDGIWTTLWTEGSTNPLTNIEQITYLLFMKNLDEIELAKEEDGELLGLEVRTASSLPTNSATVGISLKICRHKTCIASSAKKFSPLFKTFRATKATRRFPAT